MFVRGHSALLLNINSRSVSTSFLVLASHSIFISLSPTYPLFIHFPIFLFPLPPVFSPFSFLISPFHPTDKSCYLIVALFLLFQLQHHHSSTLLFSDGVNL